MSGCGGRIIKAMLLPVAGASLNSSTQKSPQLFFFFFFPQLL